MRPADRYDAEQAFASLDTDCDGRIDLASLLVLFLGLGFQPIHITEADLQRAAGGAASVTFPESVQVLSKYERFSPGSSLMDHMKTLFELVASGDNNSHWTASDVEQLARDVGEPISAQQASAMLAHLASTTSPDNEAVFTLEDFQRFWSHPDPEIDR